MNILVTGGSGWIGSYIVRDLMEHGHKVLSVDMISPVVRGNQRHTLQAHGEVAAPHLTVNITDAGQVYQALAKAQAEAVIHMAAWPNAGIVPDTRTYGENVQGTFNIFQACADMGIRRIVSASSAQVYGLAQAAPCYLPLDEEHPLRPVNCYALAKRAGEQAASYFVDNFDLTICSFRFQGVRPPFRMDADIDQVAENPKGGASLLWTRTDVRDAAMACRMAVEEDGVPSGPYNITGARTVLEEPTADLIRKHLGPDVEIRSPVEDYRSPMRILRAEKAFGYRPRYPWSVSQRHPE